MEEIQSGRCSCLHQGIGPDGDPLDVSTWRAVVVRSHPEISAKRAEIRERYEELIAKSKRPVVKHSSARFCKELGRLGGALEALEWMLDVNVDLEVKER